MTDTRIDDAQAARWAQEETLRRLLKEASVSNQILEQYVKSKLSKDELDTLKQNLAATKHASSTTTSSLRILGDRYDRTVRDAYRDLDKSLSGTFREFSRTMQSLGRDGVIGVLQNASEGAAKKLGVMSEGATGFTRALGVAGVGLATFTAVIIEGWNIVSDLNDKYLQLYESGINFTQGLRGMTQATGDLGISTEQLVGIFTQYGTTVASLGTDRAVKLGKEFVKLNRGMGELGLTNAQATEAILEYTNLIRSTGQLSRMTNRDLIEGTREYYTELNQITAITGQNRKEIQKSIEARAKEASYQALLRGLPAEVQENITKAMVSLERLGPAGAQAAQKTIVAMLARGGVSGLDPALRQALNQTGLIDTFSLLSQKAAAGADITDEMAEIAEKLGDPAVFQSFKQFADMPGPVGDMIRGLADLAYSTESLRKETEEVNKEAEKRAAAEAAATNTTVTNDLLERKREEVRKERADAAEARNKLATETQNTLNAATEILTSVFNTLVVDVLNPLIPAFKAFGDLVILAAQSFKTLTDTVGNLFRKFGSYLGIESGEPAQVDETGKEVVPRETDWADTAGSLATVGAAGLTIAGGMYAKRRLSRARRTETREEPSRENLASQLADAAGVDVAPLRTGMDAISQAGPGLGTGLKGAAAGLKAFASPQILLGAGILAGSITAVGAGIAGATWIMGKALPSLADGLRSFADIDGTKLGEVGMGMIKIGGGLVAMGVGEVASAWGSIASGITSLFTADPISKLMRFAEISEPLSKAAESMERFGNSYPRALDMLNQTTLNPAVIDSMAQIKDLLGSDMGTLFGGDPPIIGQISALADSIGRLNQNTNQISVNTPQPAQASTEELTVRTLEFYDDSTASYNSMVMLLQSLNDKIDTLDRATRDQTSEVTRAINRGGNSVF